MEDWRGALDLYESEIAVLGEEDPERRQKVWLRAGTLARDHLGDGARALRAFEAAAEVATLPLPQQREWAELYADQDRMERFAEVFAAWCDAAGDAVGADDELRLAAVLEQQGLREDALARLRRAAERAPERTAIHDAKARLEEALGHAAEAAASLERAAGLDAGTSAAARRVRAATLVEDEDPDLAARLLEHACDDAPADAEAAARLAVLALRLERHPQAEDSADRALAAAESGAALDPSLRERAALAGAEAAHRLGHLETAARLFGRVLEAAPEHPDALAAQGEVLFALGDRRAAREALERRLGLATADPQRPRHLALVGEALADEGHVDEALEQLGAALREDPTQDGAHRVRAALLEREGRIGEAVDALQAWAARAGDAAECAARLLRAAELELDRPGREEPAEALLREALSVAPDCGDAGVRLAELLIGNGQADEARRIADEAVAHVAGRALARAHAVRGRALELREDRAAAADAWQAAADADPTLPEAAFATARLRRGLGAWREAAAVLQTFTEAAPADAPERAAALHQLGRLRAGPLEDVDGAIGAYREALEADAECGEAREALAELLVHRPSDWDEALVRHRELLERDPTRLPSLRAVLRIAQGRHSDVGTAGGLALLRALGAATAEERPGAPARAPFPTGRRAALADPAFETARQVAQAAADELAEALEFGRGGIPAASADGDPLARFRAAAVEAEGELAAPALVPLDAEAAGRAVVLTAELALEAESVEGDGDLVNALARGLGRRARRRVRRALAEVPRETLAGIDWTAWRAALRGAAGAAALERTDVTLRDALRAWLPEETATTAPPEADLRAAVAASPEARALLATLVADWLAAL
jgi:tetratricopeptide (TPR) repeat protein